MEWGPQEIVFYVDGHETFRTATPADLHKPVYFLASLSAGKTGSWEGDADDGASAAMRLDYVRIYDRVPQRKTGVADLATPLSGDGAWGDELVLSGRGWDGNRKSLVQDSGGIGVSGGRHENQVDVHRSNGRSETLSIVFVGPIDHATLRLGRMERSDLGSPAEQGRWTAYDALDAVVGRGTLDPAAAAPAAAAQYDFLVDTTLPFVRVELAAVPYSGGRGGENSDFSLVRIGWATELSLENSST